MEVAYILCSVLNFRLVAKLRERLSVNRRPTKKFNMQRFDLKTLNDAEFAEQIQGMLATMQFRIFRYPVWYLKT
jgi:hypothetical protein